MHALVDMACAYAWAWSWSSLSSSSLIIQPSSSASYLSSSRLSQNISSMSGPSSRCRWVGVHVGRYPCIVKWALLRKVLHTQEKGEYRSPRDMHGDNHNGAPMYISFSKQNIICSLLKWNFRSGGYFFFWIWKWIGICCLLILNSTNKCACAFAYVVHNYTNETNEMIFKTKTKYYQWQRNPF